MVQADLNFSCSHCGACCQQLELFGTKYKWLDKGNGICRYFDCKTSLCLIYNIRPLICRVDAGYYLYFSHISYEKYIKYTNIICKFLKKRLKEKFDGNASKFSI